MAQYDQGDPTVREELGLHTTFRNSDKLVQLKSRLIAGRGRGNPYQRKYLINYARNRQVPALEDVVGFPGTPLRKTRANRIMKSEGQSEFSGNSKIAEKFEHLPHERQVYVTVIGSIEADVFTADKACDELLAHVTGMIRRRFPYCIAAVFVEADGVQVANQSSTILGVPNWKSRFLPNAIGWKVHLHIPMYVPYVDEFDNSELPAFDGDLTDAVQFAFQHHSNGKRNRYSGDRQVVVKTMGTALSMDAPTDKWTPRNYQIGGSEITTERKVIANAKKRVGYSLKAHYRAPVKEDPLIGFLDWLWLADKNTSMRSRRKLIGVNSPAMAYCGVCNEFYEFEMENEHCCWLRETDLREWYGFTSNSNNQVCLQVPDKSQAHPSNDHKSSVSLTHYVVRILRGATKLFGNRFNRAVKRFRNGSKWLGGP